MISVFKKAVMINTRGEAKSAVDHAMSQRVIIPDFEIYSSPTISISDIRKRRFNLIDRK
jgi:hypothetical protein